MARFPYKIILFSIKSTDNPWKIDKNRYFNLEPLTSIHFGGPIVFWTNSLFSAVLMCMLTQDSCNRYQILLIMRQTKRWRNELVALHPICQIPGISKISCKIDFWIHNRTSKHILFWTPRKWLYKTRKNDQRSRPPKAADFLCCFGVLNTVWVICINNCTVECQMQAVDMEHHTRVLRSRRHCLCRVLRNILWIYI